MAVRIAKQAEPIPGYKLVDRLGRGGFGEVWKATAPGGLLKAIKFVFGDMESVRDNRQAAEQELRALNRVKTIRHPFILSLERVDIIDGQLVIVMELADRSLQDRLRECQSQGLPGIPRDELLGYLTEAAEALDLMNSEHQLQHLDIKPQNLFLVGTHIKVADFGLVKDLEGMRATVTGGVTPLYAAPETFDGWVSRFSDQYSLAIVYQELLTGQRPFDGTNAGQLVMQHTSKEPDVSALPAHDRALIRRALAKKPTERFASCMDLIQALRTGGKAEDVTTGEPSLIAPPLPRSTPAADGGVTVRNADGRGPALRLPSPSAQGVEPAPLDDQTKTARFGAEPAVTPRRTEVLEPAVKTPVPLGVPSAAPVEFTGSGVLFPALVIGLGQTGSLVLQRLHETLCDRYNSLEALPHLRLLYLDTDPDAISAVVRAPNRNAALTGDEVQLLRLNRPSHFHKAREGLDLSWLDMQMLYRMPRNQTTAALRCLGRLALMDNYESLLERLRGDLGAITAAEALPAADRQTKLGLRVNRPRVYLATSLAGGSGSGMFLDVAYLTRAVLRELGYVQPEVVGLFFLPPAEGKGPRFAVSASNAWAALAELQHYSTPGNSFTARYHTKQPPLVDAEPPFARCVFLSAAEPAQAAEAMVGSFLAQDLVTPLGRSADEQRERALSRITQRAPLLQTLGVYSLSWPRRALIVQAGRKLCHRLAESWLIKEQPAFKEPIRNWTKEQWSKRNFDAEHLIEYLREDVAKKLEYDPDKLFAEFHEEFARQLPSQEYPDPEWLKKSLEQLEAVIGRPEGKPAMTTPVALVDVLDQVTKRLFAHYEHKLAALAVFFVEQPGYRFAGAEEAIHGFHDLLQRAAEQHETLYQEMAGRANKAYSRIQEIMDSIRRMKERKKPNIDNSGIAAHFKHYPSFRYKALVLQRVLSVYRSLLGNCPEFLRELLYCRTRLGELEKALAKPVEAQSDSADQPPSRPLFAAGCSNLKEAVNHFLQSVTEEEVQEIDQRVQAIIKQEFKALVHICTTPANILPNLQEEMRQVIEAHVASRLGSAGVVETFLDQFRAEAGARGEISSAHGEAAPKLVLELPSQLEEVNVVLVPEESTAEQFTELAKSELNGVDVVAGPRADDIIFYREVCGWNWKQLPHLGGPAYAAYQERMAASHFSPHSRMDVMDWQMPR